MSIIDRLNLLIRSELGAVAGRDRPGRAAVRKVVGEARASLASLRRDHRVLNRRYQDALDALDRAEDDAVDALERGDEAAADRALARKQRIERVTERLRQEREEHSRQVAELREALDGLRSQVASERTRRGGESLTGVPARPARMVAPPGPGGLEDDPTFGDVFSRFEDVEARMSELAADAAAEAALTDSLGEILSPDGVALEQKFRDLEHERLLARSLSSDDALTRLRRRINDDEA